jgi:hypothetical protein
MADRRSVFFSVSVSYFLNRVIITYMSGIEKTFSKRFGCPAAAAVFPFGIQNANKIHNGFSGFVADRPVII